MLKPFFVLLFVFLFFYVLLLLDSLFHENKTFRYKINSDSQNLICFLNSDISLSMASILVDDSFSKPAR